MTEKGLEICDKCDYFITVEEAYKNGRADAERDFQNSDYWNDYLAQVIKNAKADEIDKCKQILLDAMARDGKTKCHEYMVAVNEMEQLKE